MDSPRSSIRVQEVMKQRRIELKRYESELESIEKSERQARLVYERNKQEFLHSVRLKREKWWNADKRAREYAKKDFRVFLAKLDNGKIIKDKLVQNNDSLSDFIGSDDDDDDNDDDENDFDLNDDDDEEDKDDEVNPVSKILMQVNRSKSSLPTVRQNTDQIITNLVNHVKPNNTKSSIDLSKAVAKPKYSSTMNKNTSDIRPKTTIAAVNVMSKTPRLEPYQQISNQNSYQQKQRGHKSGIRTAEMREKERYRLALMFDRFIKNTPKSVECNEQVDKSAHENEMRLNEIKRERENAQKRDLRYFELVKCLSTTKGHK